MTYSAVKCGCGDRNCQRWFIAYHGVPDCELNEEQARAIATLLNDKEECNFQLEAGKRYIRRNKTITPPLVAEGSESFGDPDRLWYYSNHTSKPGRVWTNFEHPDDLMEEYKE